jgi:alpha,alpha-trehalose phosphorylase
MSNLSFSVQVHGSSLRVEIRADSATYRLTTGTELAIRHEGEVLHLVAGAEVTRPIVRSEGRRAAYRPPTSRPKPESAPKPS